MIIYNTLNGKIEMGVTGNSRETFEGAIHFYSEEDKLELSYIEMDVFPDKLINYRIIEDQLTIKSDEEIAEIEKYGKLLSQEEKEQLRQQEEQEKQKQIKKTATESFARLSFKMAMPTLTTTQILEFEPLVENWQKGVYIIGDIRKHLGQVWKCVQGHNNTNNPDIEPGQSPAQWSPYHSKDIKYAKPYIQPQGAHDAYMIGEYCIFEDKTYKSKIDSNVWTPKDYLQGWELI